MNRARRWYSDWKVGDFLRNFIAVVLGIALTFIGNGIIQNANERKQARTAMKQLCEELNVNRDLIVQMRDRECLEQRAFQYVYRHRDNLRMMDTDTLSKYGNFLYSLTTTTPVVDAFEMLKMSSLTTRMNDSELVINIIKAYDNIEAASSSFNGYFAQKKELLNRFIESDSYRQQQIKVNGGDGPYDEYTIVMGTYEGFRYIQTMGYLHTDPFQTYSNNIEAIDNIIAEIQRKYRL